VRREEPTRDEATRPAPNTNGSPLEVGSLVERATQRVPPSYPSSARLARVGGVVTVYVVLNEKGGVEEVRRAAGPQLLRRAAEDAARRWRFRPVTVEGQPVRATGHISFNFTL
jgi:protein TonB